MTLTRRSNPLVFTEGVAHATASKQYTCAGNGDTANRFRHPNCRSVVPKGHEHLRRGRQRHCARCAAMFFVDAEASWPHVKWAACEHCGKQYMLRRHPKGRLAYDARRDTYGATYSGECACPDARARADELRRWNAELNRRLAPVLNRMFTTTTNRRRNNA